MAENKKNKKLVLDKNTSKTLKIQTNTKTGPLSDSVGTSQATDKTRYCYSM